MLPTCKNRLSHSRHNDTAANGSANCFSNLFGFTAAPQKGTHNWSCKKAQTLIARMQSFQTERPQLWLELNKCDAPTSQELIFMLIDYCCFQSHKYNTFFFYSGPCFLETLITEQLSQYSLTVTMMQCPSIHQWMLLWYRAQCSPMDATTA